MTDKPILPSGVEGAAVPPQLSDLIPTSWLDPLLTGFESVIGNPPYSCRDIENLLNALRARMQSRITAGVPPVPQPPDHEKKK